MTPHDEYHLYIPATPFSLPADGKFSSTILLFWVVDMLLLKICRANGNEKPVRRCSTKL